MARVCRGHTGLEWSALSLSFHDIPWRVLFVLPEDCRLRRSGARRGLVPCLGITCFDCNVILINVDQEYDAIGETLFHEAGHAEKGDGRGERFIRAIERGLWRAAKACGAELPAFPRGFLAMQERARKGTA